MTGLVIFKMHVIIDLSKTDFACRNRPPSESLKTSDNILYLTDVTFFNNAFGLSANNCDLICHFQQMNKSISSTQVDYILS